MGKILNILFIAVVTALLSGCNTTGCIDNQSSIPLAGFYSYETLGAISLSNISVGGVDAPNDSLLLNHASAAEVYLPFRSLFDETVFFIRYDDTAIPDPEPDEPDQPDEGGEEPGGAVEVSSIMRSPVSRAVPAIEDTLKFKYERIPYFASADCGAMFRYRVIEFTATHNMIDSIALVDSMITNVDIQTIHIYFRTKTNDNPQPES